MTRSLGKQGMMLPNAGDLSENEKMTWSTSVQRTALDEGGADDVIDTVDNYKTAKWQINIQTDNGWSQVGVETGCPEAHQLRELYTSGKFRCVPMRATGQLVEHLAQIRLVAALSTINTPPSAPPSPSPLAAVQDDLPPSMRLLVAQMAEQQAEARRAAAAAQLRQEAADAKQAQREWDREERQERERRADRERLADERRESDNRMEKYVGMALAAVTAIAPMFRRDPEPARHSQGRDVNEALLTAVLQVARPQPVQHQDPFEMMMRLEDLADRRAERMAPPERDYADRPEPPPKDEGLGAALTSLLPSVLNLMAARSGGAPAVEGAMQQLQGPMPDMRAIAEQAVTGILQDPDALAAIASRDPAGTAKVFLAAVQRNPQLRVAVAQAFQDASDNDPEYEDDEDPEDGVAAQA